MSGLWQPDGRDPTSEIDARDALPVERYHGSPVQVARDLLGCLLVSRRDDGLTAGLIVETEAYGGPEDAASHAAFRRSGPVVAMWGAPGTAYVYVAYGIYPCFNVVTGAPGEASAVLVRAIEPVAGLELMEQRRGTTGARVAAGPGRLSIALGISLEDNGRPLDRPPLWLQPGLRPWGFVSGTRVGVRRAADRPWRFAVAGHPAVSRPVAPGKHANEGRRS